jgi:hypothetical protein
MTRDQNTTTAASSRRHTAPTTKTQANTMINLRYVALGIGPAMNSDASHASGGSSLAYTTVTPPVMA